MDSDCLMTIQIKNNHNNTFNLFSIDFDKNHQQYVSIKLYESLNPAIFATHPWALKEGQDRSDFCQMPGKKCLGSGASVDVRVTFPKTADDGYIDDMVKVNLISVTERKPEPIACGLWNEGRKACDVCM